MVGSRDSTVLVVDDNRTVADTYAAFLDEYDVRTVYDGRSAVEALSPEVDVALLDRRMPDVPGDEVLDEIDARGLDCRVVVLTAVDPEFEIVDMPFDEYLVKPVSREELASVVEEMLDRTGYDDEFRRFLALLSKKKTLEETHDPAELAASDEYAAVEERIADRREELGIDTSDVEAVFDGDAPDIAPD